MCWLFTDYLVVGWWLLGDSLMMWWLFGSYLAILWRLFVDCLVVVWGPVCSSKVVT